MARPACLQSAIPAGAGVAGNDLLAVMATVWNPLQAGIGGTAFAGRSTMATAES